MKITVYEVEDDAYVASTNAGWVDGVFPTAAAAATAAVQRDYRQRVDEDQADGDEPEPEHCRGCGNDDGPQWCEGIEGQADEDEPVAYTLTCTERGQVRMILRNCAWQVVAEWLLPDSPPDVVRDLPNESATAVYRLEAERHGRRVIGSERLGPGRLLWEIDQAIHRMGLCP